VKVDVDDKLNGKDDEPVKEIEIQAQCACMVIYEPLWLFFVLNGPWLYLGRTACLPSI